MQNVDNVHYKIRAMRESDIKDVQEIENDVMLDAWNADMLLHTLKDFSYINLICEHENQAIAYIVGKIIVDKFDLMKIAVNKKFWQQKIASNILHNLFQLLKDKNINVVELEVREQNIRAIEFYKSFHFKQVGMRKNYYFTNKAFENALTFTLILK